MQKTSFLKAGHVPSLIAAFLYFDMSFMVWVMLGPLAVQIAADPTFGLNLTPAQMYMMTATPVLAGALLRLIWGMMVDHLKPKLAGTIGQVIVIVALLFAWQFGVHSYEQTLILGVFLGVAGASFAVALPLASRWYPPEHQGTALGIAGAGNSGTAIASLFFPGLAIAYGVQNVFGIATIPLIITLVLYLGMAKDSPECPPAKTLGDYLKVLKDKDAWWFMLFYSVTFGGFVGLAGSLPIYFKTQYGLDPKMAGYFAAACVFAGSLMRPLGGFLADRIGGIKTLSLMYVLAAAMLTVVSFGLQNHWTALGVFMLATSALGLGNGSVFQLVPQRFRKEIGVMTGLVGMTGGIGGFYLISSLGYSKQLTGNYQVGFLIFAGLAVFALIGLTSVKKRWRTTWGSAAMTTAKI